MGKLTTKAPCIQKDTSQGSKKTLLSRDKTEGFVPTSTWALTNKRGGKCVLCFPTLPGSTERLCGRQTAARKVQGKILARQQGKRVGTVLSLAREWNEMRFPFLPFAQIRDVGEGGRRPHGKSCTTTCSSSSSNASSHCLWQLTASLESIGMKAGV